MFLQNPIVLIGLMGAGKTATGLHLARRLSVPFYDTDDLIVAKEGISIADIFKSKGEAFFRELEKACLRAINWQAPSIISTGGGLFVAKENQDFLLERATVVWLSVPMNTLKKRLACETGKRPLLQEKDWEKRLESLAEARDSAYRKAHWTCSVGEDSVEAIAEKIIERVRVRK